MTGKERILKALACGEPDRVPIFELAINESSIVELGKHFTDDVPPVKHVSKMTLEDKVKYVDLLALVLEELGNDGISTMLIISKEPAGTDLAKDKYGTTYMLSEVGEPLPVEGPVRGPEDLHKVAGIEPDPVDCGHANAVSHLQSADPAIGGAGARRDGWQASRRRSWRGPASPTGEARLGRRAARGRDTTCSADEGRPRHRSALPVRPPPGSTGFAGRSPGW